MSTKTKITDIFRDFLSRYPTEFFILFIFLVIEGIAAALSMLAIIPMADFLLDPQMLKISKITILVINIYKNLNIKITFWSLGALFVFLNLIKGILEVGIRYSILKIKYTVVRGLFNDAIDSFFKAEKTGGN